MTQSFKQRYKVKSYFNYVRASINYPVISLEITPG